MTRIRKVKVDEIRAVLMANWDPIGVSDEPRASDEYDGYIPGIVRMLNVGLNATRLEQHLHQLESNIMGLSACDRPEAVRKRRMTVKLLLAIDQNKSPKSD